MRVPLLLISFASAVMLAACSFNNVRSLPSVELPQAGRSVVVYGIAVKAASKFPRFGIAVDEYDIERQNISGDCLRFNRMNASVVSTIGSAGYFVFDVRPGHYVYSQFNGASIADRVGSSTAFVVPAGKVVYLGDFVFEEDNRVELHNSLEVMKKALNVTTEVLGTETMPVRNPKMFLCTP